MVKFRFSKECFKAIDLISLLVLATVHSSAVKGALAHVQDELIYVRMRVLT